VERYEQEGARVIKGEGRLNGAGRVEVSSDVLQAAHTVIATGSAPSTLPTEGLQDVTVWTNPEATTTREVPERAVVIGGGPNGIETGQWLSRMGCRVTLVQSPNKLIEREDPRVGEIIQEILEEESIDIRVGRKVEQARKECDGSAVATLDDGEEVETDVLVMVAGRTPRVAGLALKSVGLEANENGLSVGEYCQVEGIPGLWGVGDVTGTLPFTHVAQYQERVVADNLLGKDRRADYRGIPRVVFSDLEIGPTGMTEEEAREEGIDVAATTFELPKVLARSTTHEKEPSGVFDLMIARTKRVMIGARAVAPLAGDGSTRLAWWVVLARPQTPCSTACSSS
jgi:pyruvate/2-oxoglutarate dehydrogenase complex dihydrolipoamide dehydrogenase (E3) component